MKVFDSLSELASMPSGTTLGLSEWVAITQEMIDTFARLTGDNQWIHTDRQRSREGPFGTPIVHGFLILSLLPRILRDVYRVRGASLTLNYGLESVRFLNPVPSESQVRGRVVLVDTRDTVHGMRVMVKTTVEMENADRPACVAESIVLLAT